MYTIEIITTDAELYTPLQLACDSLNKVQYEFRFQLVSERLRANLYHLKRDKYITKDTFRILENFKNEVKGNIPYIILVINGLLANPEEQLTNLFGDHQAERGVAVFTTESSEKYVTDRVQFCGYYLVRYALSFVAPTLKSHQRSTDRDCIYHKKMNKEEISNSLASGKLCDECTDIIQPLTSYEEFEAINSLLKVISNKFPYALIMKGGGVKGLAFAGALSELEKYFLFNCFAGTSAGAITAVLLGAGYNSRDLIEFLENKSFRKFKDSFFPFTLLNALFKKGLYPGEKFQTWIKELLRKKLSHFVSEIEMQNLPLRTIVYASRIKDGTLVFDSKGKRKEQHAAFAVRCSMAIPGFFTPMRIDGVNVFDGGLRNNFPIKRFLDDNPHQPFIGLYLKSVSKPSWWLIKDILNMTIEGEERALVDEKKDKIVVIDPAPINTTDFNLGSDEKKYLLLSGRLAALLFIERYYPDILSDKNQIIDVQKALQNLKPKIDKIRKRKNIWKWIKRILTLGVVIFTILKVSSLFETITTYSKQVVNYLIPDSQDELLSNLKNDGALEILFYEKKDSTSPYQLCDFFETEVFKGYQLNSFLRKFFLQKKIEITKQTVHIKSENGQIISIEFRISGFDKSKYGGLQFNIDKNYFTNHFKNINVMDDYDFWRKDDDNANSQFTYVHKLLLDTLYFTPKITK